jgi:lipopolysaccharide/colanic/teichoic acid biosynthesis glycosyltransferase
MKYLSYLNKYGREMRPGLFIAMISQTHRNWSAKPPKFRIWKRVADFTCASVLLIGFAPIILLAALTIKTRGGQILVGYPCIGADGQSFRRWNFGDPLRAAILAELPQLVNVLNGTMSFVGPKPVSQGERVDDTYFTCRPGVTGLWRVMGNPSLSYAQRVKLDHRYVSECSPWLDIAILAKTLIVIQTD